MVRSSDRIPSDIFSRSYSSEFKIYFSFIRRSINKSRFEGSELMELLDHQPGFLAILFPSLSSNSDVWAGTELVLNCINVAFLLDNFINTCGVEKGMFMRMVNCWSSLNITKCCPALHLGEGLSK